MRTIIAIPSDTHAGSTVGLCPAEGWDRVDGGRYEPSEIQRLIYRQWLEGWAIVRRLRQGGRLVVIHNGDAVEGVHHDESMIISNRIDEQERIHTELMTQALQVAEYDRPAGDRIFYTLGTPSHGGSGGTSEEVIARFMCAEPAAKERYLHLGLQVKINGRLIYIAHKGPALGSRTWLTGNVLRYYLKDLYLTCLENATDKPAAVVFSHRHRWIEPELANGIMGFSTPSFQGPTWYSAGLLAAEWVSNIGMLILIIDDGRLSWTCPRIKLKRSDVIEL